MRALTNRSRFTTLTDLLRQLNWTLRGWCTYFRHGVSARTFRYLDLVAWRRVTRWLRQRHKGINWKALYRRFLTARPGNRPVEGNVVLFLCQKVEVTRYRWRKGYEGMTPSHAKRPKRPSLASEWAMSARSRQEADYLSDSDMKSGV